MNIAVGRSDHVVDEQWLNYAVRSTGADSVLGDLDDGWDTLLAREFWGGTNLSGGQWQRLGLARAWYRHAPVLMVDEPTSARDSGRVVEHGTHAELMSAAGAYAAMYRLQAAQFQPT